MIRIRRRRQSDNAARSLSVLPSMILSFHDSVFCGFGSLRRIWLFLDGELVNNGVVVRLAGFEDNRGEFRLIG